MGLIDISLLRVKAASVGINEVVQRKDSIMFYSADFAGIDMAYVLSNSLHKISVSSSGRPYISARIEKNESSLQVMKDMLDTFKQAEIPVQAKDNTAKNK